MGGGLARRLGRPRDAAIDAAVMDAAVEELIERGFSGLSIEAIAARAGVAKTTIYRRWSGIEDLVLDAMRALHEPDAEPPPGSARDTLLFLLDQMRRSWANPRYGALMRRVAADGTCQPDMYRHFRDRHIAPYVRMLDDALRQAADEGLIRPDVDLGWVRQALTAPVMAAILTHRERVSRRQVEFTLDTVLAGLHP